MIVKYLIFPPQEKNHSTKFEQFQRQTFPHPKLKKKKVSQKQQYNLA